MSESPEHRSERPGTQGVTFPRTRTIGREVNLEGKQSLAAGGLRVTGLAHNSDAERGKSDRAASGRGATSLPTNHSRRRTQHG